MSATPTALPQSTTTAAMKAANGMVTPRRLPIRCRVGTRRGYQPPVVVSGLSLPIAMAPQSFSTTGRDNARNGVRSARTTRGAPRGAPLGSVRALRVLLAEHRQVEGLVWTEILD